MSRSERQLKKDKFCADFFKNHKHEYTRVNDKGKTVCDTKAAMKAMNEQWVRENGTSKKTSKKKPYSERVNGGMSKRIEVPKEILVIEETPLISKEEVKKNLDSIASGIDPNTVIKLLPRPPLKKRGGK